VRISKIVAAAEKKITNVFYFSHESLYAVVVEESARRVGEKMFYLLLWRIAREIALFR
jgi:hypothetical protein